MPIRIQRKRTKGWRMPAGVVYVGRGSRWGNPFDFRKPDYCWAALSYGCKGNPAGRQEASVRAFREWIDPPGGGRIASSERQVKMAAGKKEITLGPLVSAGPAPSHAEIRTELRGKDLACWCKAGDPCHADVLLELANK
jgi:hypothetical protein